jgi:predicted Fe-Mo cluster-binding NifX family protein
MKIAIPVFGNRVSPRFDCANTMLLVTIRRKEIIEKKEFEIAQLNIFERVKQLANLGITKVICGGIDIFSLRLLNSHGINVIPFISGEIENVIKLFINGQLVSHFCVRRVCKRFRFRGGRLL